MVAAALIGGVTSAGASIFGASKAASAQKAAAAAATAQQQKMFDVSKGELQPFIDTGQGALNPLTKLLTPGADASAELEQIPGYQFIRNQGLKGITNQATMRGLSGNALREGADYATGLAADKAYFPLVSSLQNLANTGAGSAASLSGAATQTGAQIGSNTIGAGNAQAAAYNSIGSSVGNAVNNVTNANMFDQLLKGGFYGTRPTA